MPWRSDTPMAKAVSAAAPPPAADLGDHAVERDGGEQRAVERGDAGGGQRLGDPVVARLRILSAPPISAKPNSAARITRTSGER